MNKVLTPKFVEFIPEKLNESIIYISMEYQTVIHLCGCGCKEKVVTPLSPNDWKIVYDGQSISLHPSIGNWNFKCRSHYWVKNNNIVWAEKWTEEKIKNVKKLDKEIKSNYYKAQKHKPFWQNIIDWIKK